jgi:hypothetical protein
LWKSSTGGFFLSFFVFGELFGLPLPERVVDTALPAGLLVFSGDDFLPLAIGRCVSVVCCCVLVLLLLLLFVDAFVRNDPPAQKGFAAARFRWSR